MRRKDRQMPEEFAYGIVDQCKYAVLSTTNEDGTPYAVPMNIIREGGVVYFHCAMEGKKSDNMRAQPVVNLVCVGDVTFPTNAFSVVYESAIVTGHVREVADAEEKTRVLRLLSMRYTPDNMANFDDEVKRCLNVTAVWRIDIDSIMGKRRAP